jgi:hypothetical protein
MFVIEYIVPVLFWILIAIVAAKIIFGGEEDEIEAGSTD